MAADAGLVGARRGSWGTSLGPGPAEPRPLPPGLPYSRFVSAAVELRPGKILQAPVDFVLRVLVRDVEHGDCLLAAGVFSFRAADRALRRCLSRAGCSRPGGRTNASSAVRAQGWSSLKARPGGRRDGLRTAWRWRIPADPFQCSSGLLALC